MPDPAASRLVRTALLCASLPLPLLHLGCGSDFSVGDIEARLTTDPGFLDLGVLPVGSQAADLLTLSTDKGEVQVLGLELVNVEGSWFDVDNDLLPTVSDSGVVQVEVRYAPRAAGFHWGQLVIVTDEDSVEQHVIDVRGEARDNLVRAWPAILDFGPVRPGTTESATLTVQNEGSLPLTLTSATADLAVFSATSSFPVDLAPGAQATIALQFAPETEGAARSDLTLGFAEFDGLQGISLRGNDCGSAGGDLYDHDGDGFGYCGGDCDDWDENVHPGAIEECNGWDDDCDGQLDEDTHCSDDDGDGYSEYDGDCNDADDQVGQHAEEIDGNGIDDDCDGAVDDGAVDADGDGYTTEAGDCDDTDATVWPGASETPDTRDEDCDGTVDEGTTVYDDDGDGYSELEGDCDDSNPDIGPDGVESANWLDDDCDGSVDEGTEYGDDDGDGFSELGGDCDDADASVSPAALEVAGDGIDNDCDGEAS